LHAQAQQFFSAGLEEGFGDGLVEAGLNDTDGQFLAIEGPLVPLSAPNMVMSVSVGGIRVGG